MKYETILGVLNDVSILTAYGAIFKDTTFSRQLLETVFEKAKNVQSQAESRLIRPTRIS